MNRTQPRRSSWSRYAKLLGPALVALIMVATLAVTTVRVLGAVRAYVSGESMWSKSRAEAVQHLLWYAHSREPGALERFQAALSVPLGNRRAREAMSSDEMDAALVREQLIRGGNHPDDIDSMIVLFRWFGDKGLFRDALDAWIKGDELIAQLQTQARQLDEQIRLGRPPGYLAATVAAIQGTNAELVHTEKEFTARLGEASRAVEAILIASVLLTAPLLTLMMLVLTRRTLQQQSLHEQALAASRDRWELAAEAAGLGLFEVDLGDGNVQLDAKTAAIVGLGNTPTRGARQTLGTLVLEEDRGPLRDAVTLALQRGESFSHRCRIHGVGGTTRFLQVHGRAAPAVGDQPGRLVGVIRDVTDEQVQAQLALQRDAAQKVAQAQREFLSRLSHELRTPLNAILGFAQLMRLDTGHTLTAAQLRQVDLILTAGRQLLSLIEDVMDLSKVESGTVAMTPQPVELVQAVRACTPLIEGACERMQLELVDRLPSTPLWAQADPQRLQQVLINLLTNACKYNRVGGKVILEARLDGTQAVVDIVDTGLGLSEQDIAQIFQPFRRLPSAAQVEGSGLGLHIVKLLIERMGGNVHATGEPGVGSRFTVRLPAGKD